MVILHKTEGGAGFEIWIREFVTCQSGIIIIFNQVINELINRTQEDHNSTEP